MATLAQRLNELASANEQGLIDDDEYRVLRQDIFQRFSENQSTMPAQPAQPQRTQGSSRSSSLPAYTPKVVFDAAPNTMPSPLDPPVTPNSFTTKTARTLTAFLRRSPNKKLKPQDAGPSSSGSLKRAFSPRRSRKSSTSDTTSMYTTSSSSLRGAPSGSNGSDTFSPPTSPTRPGFPFREATSSSMTGDTFSPPTSPRRSGRATKPAGPLIDAGNDIFEDGGLNSVKELRNFIKDLEEEGRTILRAFDELEQSATSRNGAASSSDGRSQLTESDIWTAQLTRLSPSKPTALLAEPRRHQRVRSSDGMSIKSGVSSLLSKPLSRKTSIRTGPSLKRKGSVTSMSSPSLRPPLSSNSSRSTSYLPLSTTVPVNDDPEVAAVRERRLDVQKRYESRLEYLRARLKGAELHEKLMRK
ncbi:hypothetical protein CYLTODRAFT_495228 [Cylindrobasidium torrendii FP15055 ss-10]|uniref:Uncharacterized protein n=1 Tax=Cylindrobasidium torrendii FP15055 ss-10 TaxID=1314674 RepID=A0A0D7ATE9_9AGAR|nr:hypothetical protein CYLTODRAFT_495228 [Cylindrobasidium torrendii FP15055 ss-10]